MKASSPRRRRGVPSILLLGATNALVGLTIPVV
jgi:hypothetical protein